MALFTAIVWMGVAVAPPLAAAGASPRPNILWITSEDNAAHWLGCYGNAEAATPRLDAFARQSLTFTRAYANAPVCAVARSTLLQGVPAVTLGTQHMRSRYPIPESFRPYVEYLRQAGYYCTNNSKTDYNRRGDDREIWDECNGRAHYKHKNPDQPFFAVFNITVSHESSLFPENVDANRRAGTIPPATRLDPSALTVPPYLPDLPEVRQDIAIYHDCLSALDDRVGAILDELADRGLAEDTIVFYFSDHGGATPRGKRYLYDTGVRVPLLVRMPPKWAHMSPFAAGDKIDELVSFIDLAPTVLSLAGVEKPQFMSGRPLLGSRRSDPSPSPAVLLFADRFDELEGMDRGLIDDQFKYIRHFKPYLPAAPKSYYSFGVPSWAAWRDAWRKNDLSAAWKALWEQPQVVEELYDLQQDPWEINNLALHPGQKERLAAFRERLIAQMTSARDTGITPEPLFAELAGDGPLHHYVNNPAFGFDLALSTAFRASNRDPRELPKIVSLLSHEDPVVRYWASLGALMLGPAAATAAPRLAELLDDASPTVRIAAAVALHRVGRPAAATAGLRAQFDRSLSGAHVMQLINSMEYLGVASEIPLQWINEHRSVDEPDEYVRRAASRLFAERGGTAGAGEDGRNRPKRTRKGRQGLLKQGEPRG